MGLCKVLERGACWMYHAESQKKYAKEKTMVFTVKYYPRDIVCGKLLSVAIESSGKSGNEWIKEAIKEKDSVIVMEGYFDVISAHLSGVENAVGTLGSMAANDGVAGVTPDGHKVTFRAILPGHVLQFGSDDLSHNKIPHNSKIMFCAYYFLFPGRVH